MGAVNLLRDLMAEGVEFETDGERIRWSNGGAQLTPERLAVLKDGKAEVLQFLISVPDTDAFEERAAIAEFDGWLSRSEAEELAVQCQGYNNVVAFRAALVAEEKSDPK